MVLYRETGFYRQPPLYSWIHQSHLKQAQRARAPNSIGRVVSVNASRASIELVARALRDDTPTVGKFMGLKTSKAVVIGLITEVTEQPLAPATGSQTFRKVASLDLIGEFYSSDDGALRFQRGFSEYPNIGDAALMLTENMLRLVYGRADADRAHIGNLQAEPEHRGAHRHRSSGEPAFRHPRHDGVAKSSGVAIILQEMHRNTTALAHLFGRSAQRVRPLSQQGAYADAAKSAFAVLVVHFEEIVDVFLAAGQASTRK